MSSDTSRESSMEYFQTSWNAYRKILEGNYMSHVEAYSALKDVLSAECPGAFSFLDLACGDAYYSSRTLEGLSVSGYTGVDLAEGALELAKEELKRLNCNIELKVGDFSDLSKLIEKPHEVIWLGLSLHHLETQDKEKFMRDARGALIENGTFLIYEPLFLEGEDRAGYNLRIEEIISNRWSSLSELEVETLLDHVRTTELPETVDKWIELGKKAGFSTAELRYKDPHELYGLFKYTK